ncbi:MAG: branched-chain amino acid ABC transporter permease [Dehalococcoidia bacterium]|nr:branched-chain amino acid ABC transporter permease [Dehalococcoidia bacterium]MDW8008093.1 branched-chain amino acid ABC transporter permease [Chloroflexota bacterium]
MGLRRWGPLAVWAGAFGVGVLLMPIADALPFLTRANLVVFALHGIAAMGLTLVMGFAGQVSLGHAAFYGVGAYTTALLTAKVDWHPLLAMAAGAVIAAVLAALLGRIVFRLRGHFLAMATLAFGLVFYVVMRSWDSLTGGNQGTGGIPDFTLGPLRFDSDTSMYLLAWAVLLLGLIAARNLLSSRPGRALVAMGSSEVAAASVGIDVARTKMAVFALGAVYASVAGSLYAHYVTYVSPESFGLLPSLRFLVISTVGGIDSVWGAPLGSAVVVLLTEGTRELVPRFVSGATGSYEIVAYGLALVLVLLFLPRGLAGGAALLVRRAAEWAGTRRQPAPTAALEEVELR